jgi:hypothetical protein
MTATAPFTALTALAFAVVVAEGALAEVSHDSSLRRDRKRPPISGDGS